MGAASNRMRRNMEVLNDINLYKYLKEEEILNRLDLETDNYDMLIKGFSKSIYEVIRLKKFIVSEYMKIHGETNGSNIILEKTEYENPEDKHSLFKESKNHRWIFARIDNSSNYNRVVIYLDKELVDTRKYGLTSQEPLMIHYYPLTINDDGTYLKSYITVSTVNTQKTLIDTTDDIGDVLKKYSDKFIKYYQGNLY